MRTRASSAPAALIPIDATAPEPLYRQIYLGLRDAILSGRLTPASRVPSTRALSEDLSVSRNTVLLAFDQLLAEGYLVGMRGAGTRVAGAVPSRLLPTRPKRTAALRAEGEISRRAAALLQLPSDSMAPMVSSQAFRPGIPAIDLFPIDVWSRTAGRCMRRIPVELLAHGDPRGYLPLRQALTTHLRTARGVQCQPDQIFILSGSQQALELAPRVLLNPGDSAWLEEPGWLGARGGLVLAGAHIVPVPVDSNGIDVAIGKKRGPAAKLVCVSPSHQYPIGGAMSLPRRIELLAWAHQHHAWILEDDYDSEYRYGGHPLMALQGLDQNDRVLYAGTFSKTLFPSLRLGYLVVPVNLVDAFIAVRGYGDQHAPTIDQVILTAFIEEGHYARHVRRMRSVYQERREAMIGEVARHLNGRIELVHSTTGLHLTGWLAAGLDDRRVSLAAAKVGIITPPLSRYYVGNKSRQGLVLGYAASTPEAIRAGIRKLASVMG
ncbi:MAG: PLP-dependent aminotransferase family protein [Gemmatimonadota bacterium]